MTVQRQVVRAAADSSPLPIEIAFLSRHGFPMELLREAAMVARAAGSSADEAMIRTDLIEEGTFYRCLASELGLPFLASARASPKARFPHSVLLGLAPLDPAAGEANFVLAPAGERIAWLLTRQRPLGRGFAITTPSALTRSVLLACSRQIAWRAANELPEEAPHRSCRDGSTRRQRLVLGIASSSIGFIGTLAPTATLALIMAVSGIVFLGMVAIRLAAAWEDTPVQDSVATRFANDDLPVYTVIVPLRRERMVLRRLIRSLEALDYPKAKLDVKLVIEADDAEMLDALSLERLPGYFQVLVAPPGGPRTKPRALNVALPLARGEFVVVYDAEDVPDPAQLRLAVATFARVSPDVACLQARLVIDNTDDNWLTRFFTIEYATLFDVINPALAVFDLPVPLGGTSTHFRTSALQELHGWDAWNVTEDADLGVRLALAGYRVLDLRSSTLEEAPVTFGSWLRQRTRWMKGFMQVVISHSRHPLAALSALGPARFFGAVTMTFGTVATALAYPVCTALSILALWYGALFRGATVLEATQSALGLTLFLAGVVAMVAPAVAGLRRRGWKRLLLYVPLLPLYYALISLAAWRAVAELILDPFRWHKTEHGLARTSRSGLLTADEAGPARPRPAAD